MKKKLNIICWILSFTTFVLLIITSINAIIDSQAVDMLSAVVVQIALGFMFLAFFIGGIFTIKE